MYYDLHIHSALSPCSEDEMTIHNIINMSLLKGLDLVAVTDHNSVRQQKCLLEVAKDKIKILVGVEIQTSDHIHVLGYFHPEIDLDQIQTYLDKHLIVKMNNPEYYGHQLILNTLDEVVDQEPRLLISSIDRNCQEVIDDIHHLGGRVILAHVYRKYGYIDRYGQLDMRLPFDGVEVLPEAKEELLHTYPALKNRLVLSNSDAHQLGMISEPQYQISCQEYHILKGDPLCQI